MEVLEFGTGDIGALDRPVMLVGLEGWFDVASAATQAVNAFISADHAVTVGSIDPDPFYDFTQQRPHVSIDDDIREIVWPSNEFVLQRNPGHRDVVGLIGVEPHLYWKTYVEAIVDRRRGTRLRSGRHGRLRRRGDPAQPHPTGHREHGQRRSRPAARARRAELSGHHRRRRGTPGRAGGPRASRRCRCVSASRTT